MAAAKGLAGQCAMFWVVPLSGAALVLLTYGLGRRLGSEPAGLMGAWLVGTSPAFLFMLTWPMTDVPVAAAWAAAFYFLLGESTGSALAAGLSAALAILIRPNLVFGAGLLGLWYVVRGWSAARGSDGRAALRVQVRRALMFALGVLPGILAIAAINRYLYGSPTTSGYAGLGEMFGRSHVGPNLRRYGSWLIGSQTPVVLAGLAALVVPLRSLWPAARDRRVFVVVVLFVAALWAMYATYLVFDDWWYLRFLLPSWPFMMLGLAGLVVALTRSGRPAARVAGWGAVAVLGIWGLHTAYARGVFGLWQGERRYVTAARLTRESTPGNSVIYTLQHSGSVRYYGGRMTLRYDNLDDQWLDRSVAWLDAHGVHPYALLEDWEIPRFTSRFPGEQTLGVFDRPPVFIYEGPAKILLYDLSPAAAPNSNVPTYRETFEDTRCAAPAPPATITLSR